MADSGTLDDLFEELLELRVRIAANAGFSNYRDYQHRAWGRFDYTPTDCEALHRNVERHVLPVLARMRAARAEQLGLDPLRPWDLAVDPEGRPPFRPFEGQEEQVALAAELLSRIDPGFGQDLLWMQAEGLLDLDTRPDKRQGGFMTTFEDRRVPYIFSNSPPTHAGLETLVHEGGHAVHALLSRGLEPGGYRDAPLEFAEVASMGMECMAMEHLPVVYPRAEARRARLATLESLVSGFASIALIDSFQHWMYLHPGHGREERHAQWAAASDRFNVGVDWDGLEQERATGWQRIPHIYEVPFYYIEYAYAQIGALQVWSAYRSDPAAAVEAFRSGLRLGGSRPLPELFEAAGLRFDPRGELLAPLMSEVESAWAAQRAEPAGA